MLKNKIIIPVLKFVERSKNFKFFEVTSNTIAKYLTQSEIQNEIDAAAQQYRDKMEE